MIGPSGKPRALDAQTPLLLPGVIDAAGPSDPLQAPPVAGTDADPPSDPLPNPRRYSIMRSLDNLSGLMRVGQ
jgi:hypothetical protein